ncbi:hypothetical protein [Bradyrhizobium elkanii]|uniref:hypothetical protein n=1 Tax=Bradyrhizobium elkanii TaxID=29448 RepID=UPI003D259574
MSAKCYGRIILAAFSCVVLITGAVAQTADIGSELGYRTSTYRNIDAELQYRWEELGPVDKSLSYLKRAVPLYSWVTLCNAVDGSDWEFFLGECLDTETRYLLRLPTAQFRAEYVEILDRLWLSNPLDALTFSSAMKGSSTSDEGLANIAPILHLGAIVWLVVVATRRVRRNASIILLLRSVRLSRAFWISASLWIGLGILLRIAVAAAPFNRILLNLQTLVLVLFGVPAIVLGLILLVRFTRQRISKLSSRLRAQRRSADFPIKRWHALVKYGEEVAAAAATLQQFGEEWIDKLGEEFFALNEDRRCLGAISSRLAEEAQRSRLASP